VDNTQYTDAHKSLEFEQLLKKYNIYTKKCVCNTKYSNGYVFAWCSNWNLYDNHTNIPVLYIDAHYDVMWNRMILPQRIGDDIVIASCFDNRASCNIICKLIESNNFSTNYITYITFSDGEERGMEIFDYWYNNFRVVHHNEKYIVLDVTNCTQDTLYHNNLGKGVYTFLCDPLEKYIDVCDNILQQTATHKTNYPDNLCYTHAGKLYHKYKCDVGRMGIPVAGISCDDETSDNRTLMSLHISHTAISLTDLHNYYLKLCKIIERIFT